MSEEYSDSLRGVGGYECIWKSVVCFAVKEATEAPRSNLQSHPGPVQRASKAQSIRDPSWFQKPTVVCWIVVWCLVTGSSWEHEMPPPGLLFFCALIFTNVVKSPLKKKQPRCGTGAQLDLTSWFPFHHGKEKHCLPCDWNCNSSS